MRLGLRLAPSALLIVALVCVWQGVTRERAASGPAVHPTTTPILSARRLPAAIGELVASQRLAADLAGAIPAGADGCIEVRAGTSDVYAENADAALLPASNIKLVTAYAALVRLGADSHFTTRVLAAAKPVAGVIEGPLYLVGGGDPLLATSALRPSETDWTESVEPVTSLEALADRVKAAGVTAITGAVLGDDSHYDSQRTVPTWKASYVSSAQVSPVSALEVDSGFRVSGTVHVPESDPAASAAGVFARLLTARGIRVDAGSGTGRAPADAAPVASIDSLPLSDVVGVMLRESDNLAAEMLTKELGAKFGDAGSWDAGIRIIKETLTSAGIPVDGLSQVDGSGLDRSDRLTCRTLAAVLTAPDAARLTAALPTAGDCGTLVRRFVGSPAAGRVRAKTGSLEGVAALSGFTLAQAVQPRPPCPPGGGAQTPTVTFALLVNGVDSTVAATQLEDTVANALVTYPRTPILSPLGPRP